MISQQVFATYCSYINCKLYLKQEIKGEERQKLMEYFS